MSGTVVYLLYLDEFGHAGRWQPGNPRHSHHPLFGLAGVAIDGERWHDLDRGFLRLKYLYFAREIRTEQVRHGLRAERYEAKDLRPGNRRDLRFARDLLFLLQHLGATVFAYGQAKPAGVPHSEEALYTSTVQGAMKQFEKFLRNRAGKKVGRGVIVLDRRNETKNAIVMGSAQSYLFSSVVQTPFERLIETPLLVPSEWYHGVQAADMVCRIIAALYRFRAAKQASFQWAENSLGTLVDTLTARVGIDWASVYVRS